MKTPAWTKLLLAAAFAWTFASCEHTTPTTGKGGASDSEGATEEAPVGEKDISPGENPETSRLISENGFQWGKWKCKSIYFFAS